MVDGWGRTGDRIRPSKESTPIQHRGCANLTTLNPRSCGFGFMGCGTELETDMCLKCYCNLTTGQTLYVMRNAWDEIWVEYSPCPGWDNEGITRGYAASMLRRWRSIGDRITKD